MKACRSPYIALDRDVVNYRLNILASRETSHELDKTHFHPKLGGFTSSIGHKPSHICRTSLIEMFEIDYYTPEYIASSVNIFFIMYINICIFSNYL